MLSVLVRLSIIYSLCMQLRLCIILAVLRTGLKVNVMHITLHGRGGGLKYGKNGIGSNRPNTFLFIHAIFIILT